MFISPFRRVFTPKEFWIYTEEVDFSKFNKIFLELDYELEVYDAIRKTFDMNCIKLEFIEACKNAKLSNPKVREYLGVDTTPEYEHAVQVYKQITPADTEIKTVTEEESGIIYDLLHYKDVLGYNEKRLYQTLSADGKRLLYYRLYDGLEYYIKSVGNKTLFTHSGYFKFVEHSKQKAIKCMALIDMINSI